MKAALAPPPRQSPDKSPSRHGGNPLGFGRFSPAGTPADRTTDSANTTSEAEDIFPGKISSDKKRDAAGGGKKSAPGTVEKISRDADPALTAAAPPPVPMSAPGKSGAANDVPAATAQADAGTKIVSGVMPLAGDAGRTVASQAAANSSNLEPADATENADAGAGKPEPGKNQLLKNLSPVTAAEAAALSAALKPVLEKNSSMTGLAQASGAENTSQMNSAAAALAGGKNDSPSAEAIERAAENAGTGVATTLSSMKNPQKTNKVAGPDVKVLPVDETGPAREKNLPPVLLAAPVRAADNRGTDLNFAFANGNNEAPVADKTPVLNVLDLPSLADARLRAVERAHDMMTLHAMRLVESKSDSLSVVIKPAVGTELSLELRLRDGGVEALAKVTRGDDQFLSQHWSELQQRLELRGIKLAPLGGDANFSAGDNSSFSRQQAAREEAAQRASAFAEFASIRSAGGATARRAPVHDGWESWA